MCCDRKKRKFVQFPFIFHLFSQSRPMMEYEQIQSLFAFLKVLNNPSKHWSSCASWEIVKNLHHVVWIATKETFFFSCFFSSFVNEITILTIKGWISIHCYVVASFRRVTILFTLEWLVASGTATTSKLPFVLL